MEYETTDYGYFYTSNFDANNIPITVGKGLYELSIFKTTSSSIQLVIQFRHALGELDISIPIRNGILYPDDSDMYLGFTDEFNKIVKKKLRGLPSVREDKFDEIILPMLLDIFSPITDICARLHNDILELEESCKHSRVKRA